MRKLTNIIMHCSDTEQGKNFHASDIKTWHLARGFNDIGYHYVIDLDGLIELGRPIEIVGAHCAGYNTKSVGICYIGGRLNGKPHDTRTTAQKYAMQRLVYQLCDLYPTITRVHPHYKFANKACPCFNVAFLDAIASGVYYEFLNYDDSASLKSICGKAGIPFYYLNFATHFIGGYSIIIPFSKWLLVRELIELSEPCLVPSRIPSSL